jgi:hypothetical protein
VFKSSVKLSEINNEFNQTFIDDNNFSWILSLKKILQNIQIYLKLHKGLCSYGYQYKIVVKHPTDRRQDATLAGFKMNDQEVDIGQLYLTLMRNAGFFAYEDIIKFEVTIDLADPVNSLRIWSKQINLQLNELSIHNSELTKKEAKSAEINVKLKTQNAKLNETIKKNEARIKQLANEKNNLAKKVQKTSTEAKAALNELSQLTAKSMSIVENIDKLELKLKVVTGSETLVKQNNEEGQIESAESKSPPSHKDSPVGLNTIEFILVASISLNNVKLPCPSNISKIILTRDAKDIRKCMTNNNLRAIQYCHMLICKNKTLIF